MCGTAKKAASTSNCENTTWLLKSFFWTINTTDHFDPDIRALLVGDGKDQVFFKMIQVKMDVHPVLSISKDTNYVGSGTEENPYTIVN